MAQSRYLTRKTSVAWIAGTIGTPVSIASYPCSGADYNVEGAEVIPGQPSVGTYMPNFNRAGGRFATCSFSMEMFGQPSNTVPPAWGALLRACAFTEEVVSTNFFAYYAPPWTGATPTTGSAGPHLLADSVGSLDPIDLVLNIDGVANFCNDAVGTVSVRIAAGGIIMMDFVFRGRVRTGTSQTASSLVDAAQTAYATAVVPDAVRNAVSTIAGNALVTLEVGYSQNATIDQRNDINGEFAFAAPIHTGYEPMYTAVFEAPKETTYNALDSFLASSSTAFAIAHTTPSSLKRFTLSGTCHYAGLARLGDRNGKLVYEASYTQAPLSGPFTITTS